MNVLLFTARNGRHSPFVTLFPVLANESLRALLVPCNPARLVQVISAPLHIPARLEVTADLRGSLARFLVP